MDGKTIAMIIVGLVMGLFILFGIILSTGRGAFLIAGYNSLSPEEKAKYDIKKLTNFMGKLMFALASSMVFLIFAILYETEWLLFLTILLFVGIVMAGVIYLNTGERFRKRN